MLRKIEHSNKQKMCKFFAVSGNGQALLSMPDIDMLNIIHLNCNTVHTQEIDRASNCRTSTAICQGSRPEQHYTNMIQEANKAEKCYANKDNILKFDNKVKPMGIDKEPNTINYFLVGPN